MTKSKNAKKNHKPMRTCIVTKQKKPKCELVRLALDKEGCIQVDLQGKIRGRGANIVPDVAVLEEGFERKAITRALKLTKDLSIEEKDRIRKDFKEAVEEKNFRPSNKPVKIRIKKDELVKKINGIDS